MKSLIDQGQNLPDPQPLAASKTEVQKMNRQQLGIQLLAAFLNDGTIYGCEENGALYPHLVDQNLVQTFRKGMGRITIKGSGAGR
jgi:hypothetical protein